MAPNRWLHSAVWRPAYWAENLSKASLVCYGRGSHSKSSKDCELSGTGHLQSSYKGATEKVHSVCFQQCFFATRNSSLNNVQIWTFPGSDVTVREFFLGSFKSLLSFLRHGWQNKLSSTMVFSLSVLQHYAMRSVNRVHHLFRSAMITPWAVCPSSVFKNWSTLPNSV